MKNLLVIVLTLLLTACQPAINSGPVNPVPQVRTSAISHVRVYRLKSILGSDASLSLTINGKEIHSFLPDEEIAFDLDAGEYRFGLLSTDSVSGRIVNNEFEVYLIAGQTYNYKIEYHMMGNPTISRASQ